MYSFPVELNKMQTAVCKIPLQNSFYERFPNSSLLIYSFMVLFEEITHHGHYLTNRCYVRLFGCLLFSIGVFSRVVHKSPANPPNKQQMKLLHYLEELFAKSLGKLSKTRGWGAGFPLFKTFRGERISALSRMISSVETLHGIVTILVQ